MMMMKGESQGGRCFIATHLVQEPRIERALCLRLFLPCGVFAKHRATRVAAAATTTSTTQGGWLLGALLAAAGRATRRSRRS